MESRMSEGLFLKSNGVLERVRWVYDPETNEGQYVPTDVSRNAFEYLFEPVQLAGALRLKDLFQLVENNPLLVALLRRSWAAELLDEAKSAKVIPYTGEYAPDGIEFLELYSPWEYNSTTQEYTGLSRLHLHGVGFLLKEDIQREGYLEHSAGTRIHWGIDFTSLGELLDIPLRVCAEVTICEGDSGRDNWGGDVAKATYREHTLGQVLDGVFWELSFHGGPAERDARKAELDASVAEVRNALNPAAAG
jgi:hypothetical protein